jgi:hypothetical protein
MPQLITNTSERQSNPIFRNKQKQSNSMSAKARAESPEQTTAIPKTYDAIKSAAGADMKVKGRKC